MQIEFFIRVFLLKTLHDREVQSLYVIDETFLYNYALDLCIDTILMRDYFNYLRCYLMLIVISYLGYLISQSIAS